VNEIASRKRRNYLINELSKHTDEGELRSLSLAELEREHIRVKCEMRKRISEEENG